MGRGTILIRLPIFFLFSWFLAHHNGRGEVAHAAIFLSKFGRGEVSTGSYNFFVVQAATQTDRYHCQPDLQLLAASLILLLAIFVVQILLLVVFLDLMLAIR